MCVTRNFFKRPFIAAFALLALGSSAFAQQDSVQNVITEESKEAFAKEKSYSPYVGRKDDGSVDLYMGPTPPKGEESNWIKTNPDEGWFTILRLYGPLEPILEKTWKPNDIERVK